MTTPFTADEHRAARARAFLAWVRALANLPKGKLPAAPPESVQRHSGRKRPDEVAKRKPARAKPARRLRKRKPARATDAQYAAFRRRLYGKESS